jgi:hypothetical protein
MMVFNVCRRITKWRLTKATIYYLEQTRIYNEVPEYYEHDLEFMNV